MPTFYPDRYNEVRQSVIAQTTPKAREARRQELQGYQLEQIGKKGEEERLRQQMADEAALQRLREQETGAMARAQLQYGPKSLTAKELEAKYGEGGIERQKIGLASQELGIKSRHEDILDRLRDIEERRNEMLYGERGIERAKLEELGRQHTILGQRYEAEQQSKEQQLELLRQRLNLEASKAAETRIQEMQRSDPTFRKQWMKLTPDQQEAVFNKWRSKYMADMGGEEGSGGGGGVMDWRQFAK